MAQAKQMSRGLRWFLFVVGVGALIASGIYLGRAIGEPTDVPGLMRALMFVLIGLFCVLMYGENRRLN
ncbi:MAG: hypothetical protein GF400_06575 [Candidatus Eisenbacteria bacterium]|nr:hypothetical protein [Candidatus Eisenbacteria bacterium]